ncbi:MAG: T9SS type A sorting domain-containing protein [Chlorobi bacterium]|nr:T9SS type A sorting domain-containing protein [Chlorobiota bacterium]
MNKYKISSLVRFVLPVLIFITAVGRVDAQRLSVAEVNKASENWLKNFRFLLVPSEKPDEIKSNLTNIKVLYDAEGKNVIAYVVPLLPKGYIIFSNERRINPVLGYSTQTDFNYKDSPENFTLNLTRTDMEMRLKSLRNKTARNEVVNNNLRLWDEYISGKIPAEEKSPLEIIGPFVVSDWGQGYVSGDALYNLYTPNNWPAGCVATGLAQVLNYYKWPPRGVGSHGYTDNNTGYQFADFGNTIYDWPNTLDQYNDVWITDEQRAAAGTLTYHSAVSLNMDFEADGSTASTSDVPYALHSYFRSAGHYTSRSVSGFWTALKNNMLDYRPAIVAISGTGIGHAAVVSGYADNNGYYHLNPGWYGDYNGWYDISGSWNMAGYTYVNGAAKGIVPSPMIINDERVGLLQFTLTWDISVHQDADYYQLNWSANPNGPWTTVNAAIPDTFYTVTASSYGTYYYEARARRDNIWWDYSEPYKVVLDNDRELVFNVDMNNRPLQTGESLGVRGNIYPLNGSANTGDFTDDDGDGVYSASIFFDYEYVGDLLLYRFCVETGSGIDIEDYNREYTITSDDVQQLPVVEFNDVTPVELTSFTASAINDGILLLWNTATETNNKGFQVERKKEKGESAWEGVAFIEGNGTTTEARQYSFVDKNINNGKYFYRIKQIDYDGSEEIFGPVEIDYRPIVRFKLDQNYPNPFSKGAGGSSLTTIKYSIPVVVETQDFASLQQQRQQRVTLKIYDSLGREIATLVDKNQSAGNYEVLFDASSVNGNLPSGIYYYRLQFGNQSKTKKMLIIK